LPGNTDVQADRIRAFSRLEAFTHDGPVNARF
jgi:hypothetical protein